ncbi:MAG: hydroxymethylbilane synthase [Terrimicrobiaceae bacterium]|nr:hydroxymethylbilane synthase [Terrimicrobiaceae bacterium]
MKKIVLGTRGSELALVQTREAAAHLRSASPDLEVVEQIIRTTGDRRLDVKLSEPGALDKGLFTKELEEALLSGQIDAAVHSLKDLPTEQPPGLVVGAILERADSSDCLASKAAGGWRALPEGAIVATSSLRRANQLHHLRPDIQTVDIRGNVPTRLRKLAESPEWSGLIVAKAALERLGPDVVPEGIHVSIIQEMLPAPGQGAVAIECRAEDEAVLGLLATVHHEITARCVEAERELLRSLGGGCHVPLGARAEWIDGQIRLRAAIFDESGVRWLYPPA